VFKWLAAGATILVAFPLTLLFVVSAAAVPSPAGTGRYFSSRTAWPLSLCNSAITPRNLPVGKSKATTCFWPTQ
jgi:hypothetical protein